jgi:hypothetical protein
MRYRIRNKGKTLVVTVEDGDVVLVTATAKNMAEAVALRDKAFRDGPDAIGKGK